MKRVLGIIGLAVVAVLLMGGAFYPQGRGKQAFSAEPGAVVDPEWQGRMRDSCLPPSPFDLPTLRPAAC